MGICALFWVPKRKIQGLPALQSSWHSQRVLQTAQTLQEKKNSHIWLNFKLQRGLGFPGLVLLKKKNPLLPLNPYFLTSEYQTRHLHWNISTTMKENNNLLEKKLGFFLGEKIFFFSFLPRLEKLVTNSSLARCHGIRIMIGFSIPDCFSPQQMLPQACLKCSFSAQGLLQDLR